MTDKDGNIIDVKYLIMKVTRSKCYVIAKNLRIFLIEMNKNKYGCTRNNKGHKGAIPFVYEWGGFPKYA